MQDDFLVDEKHLVTFDSHKTNARILLFFIWIFVHEEDWKYGIKSKKLLLWHELEDTLLRLHRAFCIIHNEISLFYVPYLNMETRNDLTLCNRSFYALLLLRSCANLKTIKYERNLK